MNKLIAVCLVAAAPFAASSSATAQQVVHALAGTVHHINQQAGMIVVTPDDGSGRFFKQDDGKKHASLDKTLAAEVTTVSKFTESATDPKGDQVILFYFGEGDIRTAVAVNDLGKGPLDKSTGTVTKFDHRTHELTIKTPAGTETTFVIGPNTVAETTAGAVEGYRYDPAKGNEVRVTAAATKDGETALFIVPAI